jgi:glycosyl transferase family 25
MMRPFAIASEEPGAPLLEARVISLASSAARRRTVAESLAGLPYPWRFFDALSGDSFGTIEDSAERQLARFGRRLGPGEVGCFKSHAALLEEFGSQPRGADWLLVIEDDVWIDTNFPFAEIVALAEREGIHYLRLFARRYKAADVVRDLGARQLIRFRTDPYGTQAYLIDREGARRFLSAFQSIDMPIDDALGRFWIHGLDPYAIFPFPAVERGASVIQGDRSSALSARKRPDLRRRLIQAGAYLHKRLYNLRNRPRRSPR